MTYFCKACGGKTESLTELKFCGQCGQPLHPLYKTTAQKLPQKNNHTQPQRIIVREIEDTTNEENQGGETIPQIDSLEIEISGIKSQKTTLGEVAAQKKTGYKRKHSNLPKSKKKFLEFWAKDAGNLGRGNSIEIGEQNPPPSENG